MTKAEKRANKIPDSIKGIRFKVEIGKDESESKKYRIPLEWSKFSHIMPKEIPNGTTYVFELTKGRRKPRKFEISAGERISTKDFNTFSIKVNGKPPKQDAELKFEFIN